MGYVYNGNYAQYYEVGRVEMLRSLGMTYGSMEQAGVMMEEDHKKETALPTSAVSSEQTAKDDLKSLSLTELNTLLTEVLEHEDYIRAIAIRDEIKSRGK